MSVIQPSDLITDLADDKVFLTPVFVGSVLTRVMPLSRACVDQTLLFVIPVYRADGIGCHDADVAIYLGNYEALHRLYVAFSNEQVRYQGGSPEPGIFGFIGSYAAIHIGVHSRLACLYVRLS